VGVVRGAIVSSEYSPQNVVVLEGLEPVRLRPGMYVGGIGPQGLEVMVLEAISNAADQYLTGGAQRIDVRVSSDAGRARRGVRACGRS
jgi:DNA gyrase/topoisomerase IV subunit B